MTTTNIPMSGDAFVASCKRWGLTVVEHGDWRNHNRLGGGRVWGPVNGFMVHNFASDISDVTSVNYLINGDAARGMPGPLSQLALDDEGRVHMIGWGRGNHAGVGDAAVLSRVIADTVPLNGELKPAKDTVDGNARFVGVEMLYGKGPTAKTRAALPLLCAAFLDVMGWGATSVIAHREWTVTRSDPVGFDMGAVRRDVAALLKAGPPSAVKPPVTPPQPPINQEDDIMAMTPAERAQLVGEIAKATAAATWAEQIRTPFADSDYTTTAASWLRMANVYAEQGRTGIPALAGQVAGLSKALEQIKAGQTLDLDAITAASKAGTEDAMKGTLQIDIGLKQ